MNLRRQIAWLAVPYVRHELPGWGRLLRELRVRGAGAEAVWKDAGIRRLRGKWHGYTMILDLENWSERISYFLRRYYDLPSQLVLRALLRPGDQVLDVGANIGMMSLLAAHLVGPEGRVDAFEPNPDCVDRIREVLRENRIGHVRVHPIALSDRDGTAVLTMPGTTTGSGTLCTAPEWDADRQRIVKTARGDDVVNVDLAHPIAVKLDVEGHEVHALRGLERLLVRCRPGLLVETIEAHLAHAGFEVRDLIHTLEALGYEGFEPCARRNGLGYRLRLRPLGGEPPVRATDTVWLHPDSEAFARLSALIARDAQATGRTPSAAGAGTASPRSSG